MIDGRASVLLFLDLFIFSGNDFCQESRCMKVAAPWAMGKPRG